MSKTKASIKWMDVAIAVAAIGLALVFALLRPSVITQPTTYNYTEMNVTTVTVPPNATVALIGGQQYIVTPLAYALINMTIYVPVYTEGGSFIGYVPVMNGTYELSGNGTIETVTLPSIFRLVVHSITFDGIPLNYPINITVNRLSNSLGSTVERQGPIIIELIGNPVSFVGLLYPGGEYITNATNVVCGDAVLPPTGQVPTPVNGTLTCYAAYAGHSFPFKVYEGRVVEVVVHAPHTTQIIRTVVKHGVIDIQKIGVRTPYGYITGVPFIVSIVVIIVLIALLLDSIHHYVERRGGGR